MEHLVVVRPQHVFEVLEKGFDRPAPGGIRDGLVQRRRQLAGDKKPHAVFVPHTQQLAGSQPMDQGALEMDLHAQLAGVGGPPHLGPCLRWQGSGIRIDPLPASRPILGDQAQFAVVLDAASNGETARLGRLPHDLAQIWVWVPGIGMKRWIVCTARSILLTNGAPSRSQVRCVRYICGGKGHDRPSTTYNAWNRLCPATTLCSLLL
jgi:hypothetical protein